MKTIISILVLLFVSVFANAQATRVVVPIGIGSDTTVQPYGWIWSSDDDVLSMARLRFDIISSGPVNGFVELDVTDGVQSDVNWLQQAYLFYEPIVGTTIRVGRLFLAAPLATDPPFRLKTAEYARYPFRAFGWGIQVLTKGQHWELAADVTASSSARFNESESLQGLESSARLTYNLSSELQIGGIYQFADGDQRFAGELTWRPDDRQMVNIVGYQTRGIQDLRGGYVFYEYISSNWIAPHVQFDYQAEVDNEWLATVGVRFDYNRFRLIVDHEFGEGITVARLQVMF